VATSYILQQVGMQKYNLADILHQRCQNNDVAEHKHKKTHQCLVVFIDQWYPSSKTCSNCGHVLESLDLSVREWRCPSCQSLNGRDENAAKNICAVGASTAGLGDVRRAMPAIAV
jgi:transposase